MRKTVFTVMVVVVTIGMVSFAGAVDKPGIWKGERNGVACMTGGVGLGEREDMQRMAGDYNLKVVTAKSSGAYLGRLPVTIYDEQGRQVLAVSPNGPWLYTRLPQGRYTVHAAYNGIDKSRALQVDSRMQVVRFTWQ